MRKPEAMTRTGLIERLAERQPSRRGFGGSADPLEAAAFRLALRGDHDLNPGMTPPSTALRPAAVLVPAATRSRARSEEHTSELQSRQYLVCRLLLEKKNNKPGQAYHTTRRTE